MFLKMRVYVWLRLISLVTVWTGTEVAAAGDVEGYTTVSDAGQCSNGMRAHVTGRMWRNASGHWTATAHMVQSAHAHVQHGALQLEAEPSLRRCQGQGVLSLTLTIKGPSIAPGPGYEETNVVGSYYKVHKEKKSWEDAKKVCEEENAHLLVLNSQEEADAIKELLKKHNANTDYSHIGFTDKDKEGHYVTLFGQTLLDAGYAKWHKNEPSKTTIENCGSIVAATIELNDMKCTGYETTYICEQQA